MSKAMLGQGTINTAVLGGAPMVQMPHYSLLLTPKSLSYNMSKGNEMR